METERKPEQDNNDSNDRKQGKWPQRLAASLAAITTLCGGIMEGWTSPALPYLQGNHTSADLITNDEASWIGSLGALGALFGAIPAGYLADVFGRKTVLLMLSIPFLVGWIIITLSGRIVPLLYAARFILGLSTGASTVVVPLYNEEIAETRIRGELGTYLGLTLTGGILYAYAIGAFVPYTWLCIACAVVPVVFCATFYWMPESPLFLLSKGKTTEAEKSLRWLRNFDKLDSWCIKAELQEMADVIKKPEVADPDTKNCERKFSSSSPIFKTISIVVALMLFQQLSGINAIIFYTVDIFEAAGSTLSPYYCTLIVGVVQVISTYIAAVLMDRLGRRILLLFSGIVMGVSLLLLAVFSFYKENGSDMNSWHWLPLVVLITYITAFCAGFGPIPLFMMVELATTETKGWVSSLGVSVNWIMVFVVTKLFTMMLDGLGQDVTYGIFCILCIFGAIFVAFCVPETKGKTREDIQNELAGKLT